MTLTIRKADGGYILLEPDEQLPAFGEKPYFHAASAALISLKNQVREFAGIPGAYTDVAEIEIEANAYASKKLIAAYGFKPV